MSVVVELDPEAVLVTFPVVVLEVVLFDVPGVDPVVVVVPDAVSVGVVDPVVVPEVVPVVPVVVAVLDEVDELDDPLSVKVI